MGSAVVRVEITTADGIIRLWTDGDAAKWGAYMARQHGAEPVPKPTVVVNAENAPTYRKAKDALRQRKRKAASVGDPGKESLPQCR